jgi:hypothetical protein
MFRSLGVVFAVCALSTLSYAQEFTPHTTVYNDKIKTSGSVASYIDNETGFYYIKGSYTYVPKYCLTTDIKRGHLMQTKDNKLYCAQIN